MKAFKFNWAILSLLLCAPAFAQVQIDKQLQLTGSSTDGKITGIKSVTANQDGVNVDAIQKGNLVYATATGGTNTFTLTLSPPITAYQSGMVFNFMSNQTVTGTTTLAVNGLSAVSIKKYISQDLSGCEIQTGQIVSVVYDGANFQLISFFFPGTLSAAVATAGSGATQSQITANWAIAPGATGYYLDVATDAAFTSFVSGYNHQNMGNVNSATITGLNCGTPYYYRVTAYNTCGTSNVSNTILYASAAPAITCGSSFTDCRDGKTYGTVSISGSSSPYCTGSSQCWMSQNLNVGTQVSASIDQFSGSDNQNTSIEKYCFANDANNCTTYGGLYQWNEMMAYGNSVSGNGPGPQGICPTGWHLPTDNEWKCMEMNLSSMSQSSADATGFRGTDEGNKLKTAGNGAPPQWASPSAGTNSSGFSGLSGSNAGPGTSGAPPGYNGYWWTTTADDGSHSWSRGLNSDWALVYRYSNEIPNGFSVRCIKN